MVNLDLKYVWFALLSVSVVSGLPYTENMDDMYSGEYDGDNSMHVQEIAISRTPKYISESMSMLVNEGETVRLPCMVDRLQGFVLLWKKKEDILAVGKQIIDKKFKMDINNNGNNLIIEQISPEEEGEYTCQVSAYEPKFLTHKITVRVEPEIETVPSELLVVRRGSLLLCPVR